MPELFLFLVYFIGFILIVLIAAILMTLARALGFIFAIMWICMRGIFTDIKESIKQ